MKRTCQKLELEGLSLHSFPLEPGWVRPELVSFKQLMGHSCITVSQSYVHKLTRSIERAMALMEEANKVGTNSGHIPNEDAALVPAKPTRAAGYS